MEQWYSDIDIAAVPCWYINQEASHITHPAPTLVAKEVLPGWTEKRVGSRPRANERLPVWECSSACPDGWIIQQQVPPATWERQRSQCVVAWNSLPISAYLCGVHGSCFPCCSIFFSFALLITEQEDDGGLACTLPALLLKNAVADLEEVRVATAALRIPTIPHSGRESLPSLLAGWWDCTELPRSFTHDQFWRFSRKRRWSWCFQMQVQCKKVGGGENGRKCHLKSQLLTEQNCWPNAPLSHTSLQRQTTSNQTGFRIHACKCLLKNYCLKKYINPERKIRIKQGQYTGHQRYAITSSKEKEKRQKGRIPYKLHQQTHDNIHCYLLNILTLQRLWLVKETTVSVFSLVGSHVQPKTHRCNLVGLPAAAAAVSPHNFTLFCSISITFRLLDSSYKPICLFIQE